MKSPRTFPRLVMKEWPKLSADELAQVAAERAFAKEVAINNGATVHPRVTELKNRVLSDFTRVVDQTGILRSDSDKIAE